MRLLYPTKNSNRRGGVIYKYIWDNRTPITTSPTATTVSTNGSSKGVDKGAGVAEAPPEMLERGPQH